MTILVDNVCMNNPLSIEQRFVDEGGLLRTMRVRQATRVRLFKDRVMRVKSNIVDMYIQVYDPSLFHCSLHRRE